LLAVSNSKNSKNEIFIARDIVIINFCLKMMSENDYHFIYNEQMIQKIVYRMKVKSQRY